jgi:phospholipid/cholesterol/gamma-HCH transport system permease protein
LNEHAFGVSMFAMKATTDAVGVSSSPIEELERDTLTLRLAGELDTDAALELHRRLLALEREAGVAAVVLDFSSAGRVNSAAVAAITLAARRLLGRGKKLRVQGLADHHRSAFALAAPGAELKMARRLPFFEAIGDSVFAFLANAQRLLDFIGGVLRACGAVIARKRPPPLGTFIQQASLIGVDALPIVGLLSLLLGLTLAFQSALQLDRFGAGLYLADIVCLSMVRELGPMMAAILISARSGSAITSELSAMNVREEIDAMRTMGLDPYGHLVVPRLAALTLALPALTLMSMLLGILGGLVISQQLLELAAHTYVERALEAVSLRDFGHGLAKSVLFAWIIGITACSVGLATRGGPQNIGRATTRTVVTSLFLIIVADSLIATVMAATK